MKAILDLALKSVPIIAMAVISYILLAADEVSLDEGMKLSLSALLGALASYIFIQYSEFLNRIEAVRNNHYKALHSLDIKLNLQLNWLADVGLHLDSHIKQIEDSIKDNSQITFNTSSYRDPIRIDQEIHDVNNLTLKNELISLKTGYDKIENDVITLTSGHKFGIDGLVGGGFKLEDYIRSLPNQLENAKTIKKFTKSAIVSTTKAIATTRVLAKNTRNPIQRLRKYLVAQGDPENLKALENAELQLLLDQINQVKEESKKEIEKTMASRGDE